ncbi:glycosyltransferase [Aureococcus anophagefferens]|nr:glycosyltransferase [Aureococcus anophagefferens]
MARRSSPDPVITVQRAKRSGAKSGGGASYSAVAIVAAIIMLQGAATLVLHGKWHAAGHGAHHSLEEEHDAPPVAPAAAVLGPRAAAGGWPRESIFISIASYRDPECAKTVARAYARAASPERVFFGIYQQNNASVDVDCVAGLADLVACPDHPVCGRLDQLRVHRVDWKQTLGPTIARHLSEKFYRGETYRIGNPRAIITTYPASYSATKSSEKWQDVDASGPCLPCRRTDDQASIDVKVLSSSQMSICRTRRVQVPYDAHSLFLFDGEETSLAVRAWTHGYDFYHPDRDVVSHLYIPSKSPLRPVFWTDDWDLRSRIQFWTMLRRYGCGSKRRAVDYWGYVGVTPDRDGAEWSPGRCDVFSTTGLPSFPVDERGAHNDYDAYADAFPKAEMLEAAVDAKYDAQAARMPRGRSTLPLQDRTAAPPEVMAEESKYAGGATSLTDLRELVERQDLKIEALTALVRAQQITMDRLLRAVEKGAPRRRIEAEALANARFEEQRQAAARREAERAAAAEAEAERQRAAQREAARRLEQQQLEERLAIQRAEAERVAAARRAEEEAKRAAEEAEAFRVAEEKRVKQEKLNASRKAALDGLLGDDDPGEDSLFGSSVTKADTASLFD